MVRLLRMGFRIVSARRLDMIEALESTLRRELQQTQHQLHVINIRAVVAEQARDFHQKEHETWERRACRLIDQIGVSSATLSAPAMGDPAAPPPSQLRQVMTAIGTPALSLHKSAAAAAAPQILGVNEHAAAAAVADALERR